MWCFDDLQELAPTLMELLIKIVHTQGERQRQFLGMISGGMVYGRLFGRGRAFWER